MPLHKVSIWGTWDLHFRNWLPVVQKSAKKCNWYSISRRSVSESTSVSRLDTLLFKLPSKSKWNLDLEIFTGGILLWTYRLWLERHEIPERSVPSILKLAWVNLGKYLFKVRQFYLLLYNWFTYSPKFQKKIAEGTHKRALHFLKI